MNRGQLGKIARLVVERNGFARPVHQLNMALYGSGFTTLEPCARYGANMESSPYRPGGIMGDPNRRQPFGNGGLAAPGPKRPLETNFPQSALAGGGGVGHSRERSRRTRQRTASGTPMKP